jgi:DNA-binding response OmpR family regulator|tara:strand:+ start:383 stop:910 length:528 start_codon:yes stop_codon:yes gene_type:complete
MISLYSNDKFLSNVIVDLIIQINPNFISHNSALCFASIKVEQSQDHICLLYDKKKNYVKIPFNISEFFETIFQLVVDEVVYINNFKFFPFKQVVSYQDQKIKLNFISNEIIKNIYLHKKKGILKDTLYSMIWPKDKEILINKLDTHLTNTKNLIEENFKIEFKYSSKKGIIGLLD